MTFYDPSDLRPTRVVHVTTCGAGTDENGGGLAWTTAH
jgi:hypothetical protein